MSDIINFPQFHLPLFSVVAKAAIETFSVDSVIRFSVGVAPHFFASTIRAGACVTAPAHTSPPI